jgi:hypothetical protein
LGRLEFVFDEDINSLTAGTEVWLMDFAMTYTLVQTAKETQSQFFDKKYANDLGDPLHSGT